MAVSTGAIGKTYPAVVYAVGREKIREYASAVGETNPLYFDVDAARAAGFARGVGLPGRILHGLWTMAQVARAHTDAAGGPEGLKRLSVQFRGMGRMGEEITVSGTVREVKDGIAVVESQAEQAGHRLIRNGLAEIALQ